MIPPRVVLATGNAGKVRELRALLAEWGPIAVDSLADHRVATLPEERGETYLENAILKAQAVAGATGLPSLADDSGLEVDALHGGPGVRSARYAPTNAERIARLLMALDGVAPAARTARFQCVVALAWPHGRCETASGSCEGRILSAAVGTEGFGYDPIFYSADLGRPFGQVTAVDKERVSHRARAIRALGVRMGWTCSP